MREIESKPVAIANPPITSWTFLTSTYQSQSLASSPDTASRCCRHLANSRIDLEIPSSLGLMIGNWRAPGSETSSQLDVPRRQRHICLPIVS